MDGVEQTSETPVRSVPDGRKGDIEESPAGTAAAETSQAKSFRSSLERVESNGELDHRSMFDLGQITVENHPLSRPLSPGCGIKHSLSVSDAVQ